MKLWISPILWHLRWPTVTGFYRNFVERRVKCCTLEQKEVEELRERRRKFSDAWNIFTVVASGLVLWSWYAALPRWLLLGVGWWRVYEITLNQANVLFTTDCEMTKEKTQMVVPDPRRLLLVGLFNYAEVVFWFATLYRAYSSVFFSGKLDISKPSVALYYSLVTMTTLGYGDVPPTASGVWLVTIHLAVGIFLTLMVLARFVSAIRVPDQPSCG